MTQSDAYDQVRAERETREAMAVPLDQREAKYEYQRAEAAWNAYCKALPNGTLEILTRAGVSGEWKRQPIMIQEAWIAATKAACAF